MPSYNKALFLYNGNAGSAEIQQKLSQTLPKLSEAIEQLFVFQTKSVAQAKEKCESYASVVDIIIILGGDGTIHECINTIARLDKRPVIGILPGGTCNDFSRMLGIPQNLNQATIALLKGKQAPVDVGKAGASYFLNFWGIGLVTETSANINEEQKNRFGVLSYFISTLKTMNQATPFSYEITIDDDSYVGDAVMILVLNGRFLGTRQIPIPSIDANDGMLDILIIKNSNLTLFRELMTMTQDNVEESNLTELAHLRADNIKVETDMEQEVDMDGEIYGVTPASIEILPGHLQMIFAAQ